MKAQVVKIEATLAQQKQLTEKRKLLGHMQGLLDAINKIESIQMSEESNTGQVCAIIWKYYKCEVYDTTSLLFNNIACKLHCLFLVTCVLGPGTCIRRIQSVAYTFINYLVDSSKHFETR